MYEIISDYKIHCPW